MKSRKLSPVAVRVLRAVNENSPRPTHPGQLLGIADRETLLDALIILESRWLIRFSRPRTIRPSARGIALLEHAAYRIR